jgi:hypothetical protein
MFCKAGGIGSNRAVADLLHQRGRMDGVPQESQLYMRRSSSLYGLVVRIRQNLDTPGCQGEGWSALDRPLSSGIYRVGRLARRIERSVSPARYDLGQHSGTAFGVGGLIQVAAGLAIGTGALLTNRAGCSANARSSVTCRAA